jgi:hypothetical protein
MSKNVKIRIHKSTIFPVVLHRCETGLYIKGGTQTEVVREQGAEENIWTEQERSERRLLNIANEELHKFYSWAYIIRMIISMSMRWVIHVARMGRR